MRVRLKRRPGFLLSCRLTWRPPDSWSPYVCHTVCSHHPSSDILSCVLSIDLHPSRSHLFQAGLPREAISSHHPPRGRRQSQHLVGVCSKLGAEEHLLREAAMWEPGLCFWGCENWCVEGWAGLPVTLTDHISSYIQASVCWGWGWARQAMTQKAG